MRILPVVAPAMPLRAEVGADARDRAPLRQGQPDGARDRRGAELRMAARAVLALVDRGARALAVGSQEGGPDVRTARAGPRRFSTTGPAAAAGQGTQDEERDEDDPPQEAGGLGSERQRDTAGAAGATGVAASGRASLERARVSTRPTNARTTSRRVDRRKRTLMAKPRAKPLLPTAVPHMAHWASARDGAARQDASAAAPPTILLGPALPVTVSPPAWRIIL